MSIVARENYHILGRARFVGRLIQVTLNLHSAIFDLNSERMYVSPKDPLSSAQYEQLAKLNSEFVDINYIYQQFKKVHCTESYKKVSFYYGTASIVIPIRHKKDHVANLVVGPVLTRDPNEIVLAHLNCRPRISSAELYTLKTALSTIQRLDARTLEESLQIVFMLLNKDISELSCYGVNMSCVQAMNIGIKEYPQAVETAVNFISDNYMNSISLSDVARHISIHPTYLSKLFHKHVGCSYREYVNRLRVSRARQLLLDPDKSIAEISAEVGFFDQSYFCRIFKVIEGIPPGQFRRISLLDCYSLSNVSSFSQYLSPDHEVSMYA